MTASAMTLSPGCPPYFCGIDVAKRKHKALCLDANGQVIQPAFTLTNDRCGFDRLLQTLQPLEGSVTVALEATGHYWLALYKTLTAAGYRVLVFNPIQIHAYRCSRVRRCKTDPKDAFLIADFARIGNGRPAPDNLSTLLQLRELTRFRFYLTSQIGDCKRKILSVLDRVFPEYETLFTGVFLVSSRRLLAQAVTAEEFAEFDLGELQRLLQVGSRGRFDAEQAQQKAQRLQELARQSVGVPFLSQAARIEVSCLLAQLDLLLAQREQVDQALEALMAATPQQLTSIVGIGPTTAAALLAEIGEVTRFATLERLVAFAGIDATVNQSREFEAKRCCMSKRGSAYLRRALWQAALIAIQQEGELKEYYQKRRTEGKAHGTVLGAICRKLLARVFVILKERRPYEVRPPKATNEVSPS